MVTSPQFEHLLSETTETTKRPHSKERPEDNVGYVTDDEENTEMENITKKLSKVPAQDSLMESEEKGENAIGWSVYYDYMKASGSRLTAPLILFLCCFAQASQVMATFWLGYWTNGTYSLSRGTYVSIAPIAPFKHYTVIQIYNAVLPPLWIATFALLLQMKLTILSPRLAAILLLELFKQV